MTVMQHLGQIERSADAHARASEFVHYAKYLMLERGSVFAALRTAEANRATPRIVEVLKAAATAGTTTDAAWASPLAPYSQMVDGFLAGLNNAGAFDAMFADMRSFPLHTQIAATTVVASASTVAEAGPKPASKLTTVNGQL